MSGKRKPEGASESSILRITPLGAGSEVGRSCIVIEYKNKKIMLDAGVHPAFNGIGALPFFDMIDPAEIDILLVTHFHLDHAGAVPYFMEKTAFRGRTFMTHPTKAIYKWLLGDYVRVSNVSAEEQLYNEEDLRRSFDRIEAIDYHQVIEVDGVRFSAFNAGHVLGAAMFLIEIAGVKLLYTGDYSREEDRHLMAAENPGVPIDVLICESTYGVQSHEPRLEREARFTTQTHQIVQRGGRCLIPVFALGRAQELLLILDEYWEAHPELDSIPIYYASALAKKCMAIYQTYINMMNEHIRRQFAVSNPFVFKHISNLRGMAQFEDVGPCVMVASPGMLQNGLSRQLFERWCTDKRNGILITGYSVEGTLARRILNEPTEIEAIGGGTLPVRLTIGSISFSAHVDYTQNSQFIYEVKAPHVVLVHGETNNMGRLRSALQDHFADHDLKTKVYTPRNCETVELLFKGEKIARVTGQLAVHTAEFVEGYGPSGAEVATTAAKTGAETEPTGGMGLAVTEKGQAGLTAGSHPVSNGSATPYLDGILVAKDYQYHIMDDTQVAEFTGLYAAEILQRQAVPYHGTRSLLRYHLNQMFGMVDGVGVEINPIARVQDVHHFAASASYRKLQIKSEAGEEEIQDTEVEANTTSTSPSDSIEANVFRIYNAVDVVYRGDLGVVELEWSGNHVNDMVADSVVAVILNIECSPASVKMTKSTCGHNHHPHGPADDEGPAEEDTLVGPFDSTLTSDHVNLLARFLARQFGPAIPLTAAERHALEPALTFGRVDTTPTSAAETEKKTTGTPETSADGTAEQEEDEGTDPAEPATSTDMKDITKPATGLSGNDGTIVALQLMVDEAKAIVDLRTLTAQASDEVLHDRVAKVLARVKRTLRPITE
ncbi:endoribonuclease ysh1 [Tieghemiomyces parasiticus]|uniref:Endoribonuclease YSH1 n=1 Tax=Tieghemiomyces parasiticus TaxID=78921 RepID=A0A9W7ZNQ3_9FUNG|nr:endoribonuclease ysh1 [Tieghemiomyces parasiticus]